MMTTDDYFKIRARLKPFINHLINQFSWAMFAVNVNQFVYFFFFFEKITAYCFSLNFSVLGLFTHF